MFPLVSYDNFMDSVETPKTVALHICENENQKNSPKITHSIS
jgi:hypothetical protein